MRPSASSGGQRSGRSATHRGAEIPRTLLAWYSLHARRLPWREHRNPYPVWVSEIMLQQTQVATVIPYFRRFLRVFPTVSHLAQAPLERVLGIWSGLGYYRRARHLHRAAQILTRAFGGAFPADYWQIRSLPGIGDNTARALLSIAYNLPYAVLDGNVARIIARLIALRGNLRHAAFRQAAESELERLLSREQPGDFNQSLMELGQTVCLPRTPRCLACPLRNWCRGYRSGRPESYPAARPRRPTESRHLAVAVVRRGSKLAMVQGLEEGLLADLLNFPAAFGNSRAGASSRLREKLSGIARAPVAIGKPTAELTHRITFRSIRVHIYPVRFPRTQLGHSVRWFAIPELKGAAVSQLARKIAKKIKED